MRAHVWLYPATTIVARAPGAVGEGRAVAGVGCVGRSPAAPFEHATAIATTDVRERALRDMLLVPRADPGKAYTRPTRAPASARRRALRPRVSPPPRVPTCAAALRARRVGGVLRATVDPRVVDIN